jgi:hypothetical protein
VEGWDKKCTVSVKLATGLLCAHKFQIGGGSHNVYWIIYMPKGIVSIGAYISENVEVK